MQISRMFSADSAVSIGDFSSKSGQEDEVSSGSRRLRKASSLHTPKSIKPRKGMKSSRRTTTSRKRTLLSPAVDCQLLREQKIKEENERREFEEDRVRFDAKTQARRKLFSKARKDSKEDTSSAEFCRRSAKNKLLQILARRESDLSNSTKFLEDEDLHSMDGYSVPFTQPTFDSLTKRLKEYNSDNRIRG